METELHFSFEIEINKIYWTTRSIRPLKSIKVIGAPDTLRGVNFLWLCNLQQTLYYLFEKLWNSLNPSIRGQALDLQRACKMACFKVSMEMNEIVLVYHPICRVNSQNTKILHNTLHCHCVSRLQQHCPSNLTNFRNFYKNTQHGSQANLMRKRQNKLMKI